MEHHTLRVSHFAAQFAEKDQLTMMQDAEEAETDRSPPSAWSSPTPPPTPSDDPIIECGVEFGGWEQEEEEENEEHSDAGPMDPLTYVSLDGGHQEEEKEAFSCCDDGGNPDGKIIPGKMYSEQYVQNLRREHKILENFIRCEKDQTIAKLWAINESLRKKQN